MATAGSGGHHEFDLKVPVMQGDTTKDFKKYEKVVKTHVLSITGRDETKAEEKKERSEQLSTRTCCWQATASAP